MLSWNARSDEVTGNQVLGGKRYKNVKKGGKYPATENGTAARNVGRGGGNDARESAVPLGNESRTRFEETICLPVAPSVRLSGEK